MVRVVVLVLDGQLTSDGSARVLRPF
jgi:hypothetical protein